MSGTTSATPRADAPVTVVTGADARYARTLHQMLRSAERHGLHRRHPFVAFDLGLTSPQKAALEQRFDWCAVRPFPFEAFPPHVRRLHTFAWKPIAIAAVLAERPGPLLWLDSATLFHGCLDPIVDRIAAHGVFTLLGQSSLAAETDPRTLQLLEVSAAERDQRARVAGAIGVDGRHPVARDLIDRWRDLALVEACIAPPNAQHHRPDQSLFSVLLYRFHRERALVLLDEEVDISSGRPVPWISTRNKVPPWMPLVADPFVRAWYAVYKRVDRALWRLKNRRQRRFT